MDNESDKQYSQTATESVKVKKVEDQDNPKQDYDYDDDDIKVESYEKDNYEPFVEFPEDEETNEATETKLKKCEFIYELSETSEDAKYDCLEEEVEPEIEEPSEESDTSN
jgi:hypothetical protein